MPNRRFLPPSPNATREFHLFPISHCWSCGEPQNCHCGPGQPNAGEVCLCLNCTAINIFDDDGGLRDPTPDELASISLDPDVRELQRLMQAANRRARLDSQSR